MSSDRLRVEASETYTVESGTTDEYSGATVDGTLDVNGTLELIDDPSPPVSADETVPDTIDLPLGNINFTNMQTGVAVFLLGTVGILGGIATVLRNYLALSVLMLAVVVLIMSGMFGAGLELFWVTIIGVLLLLAGGVVLRWF